MKKVRWGVLSTARIGTEKVIPAMQQGAYSAILGIASRTLDNAVSTAKRLNIPKYYGSYEELLADNEIDAVYIPLPNHLHVEWAIKSLQAGKHVLCEKPLGLNLADVEHLYQTAKQFPHLKIMEAFMYRFHPQWETIRLLINDGIIGEVKHVNSMFSYYNVNPSDIRNQKDIGGGGLLDIGCYCISLSRFIFGEEPQRVFGSVDYDERWHTDKFTAGIIEFKNGRATFTCSTQLAPHQYSRIAGTKGTIEIDLPFTPSPDKAATIKFQNSSGEKVLEFESCNQYTLQGDLFSQAILQNKPLPIPLSDGVKNIRVVENIFKSAHQGTWI